MRPSTRLPLREALYVCSNCRAEVTPRGISPLTRQFRRHASSDSPSFLEWARRSLWKGDKPPGPEDPYSGESQIARKMGWKTKASETEDANERGSGSLASGDDGKGGKRKSRKLSEGDSYAQAETWDGLEHIGFTKDEEWLLKGATRADEYTRYGVGVRTRPILYAAHQAAVEIALLQMLGKPLASICDIGSHLGPVTGMLDGCVVGGSETQQWNTTLRFPNQKTMDVLFFVFKQIGESTESKQIEAPETLLIKEKQSDEQGYRALSLADPAVKFAYFKRLYQLTGRHIPDKIISSSATINEVIIALASLQLKEKPKNVSKKLTQRRKDGKLPPNVVFTTTRLSKGDNDEALGRKKAIHAELYSRGLVLPKKAKKDAA